MLLLPRQLQKHNVIESIFIYLSLCWVLRSITAKVVGRIVMKFSGEFILVCLKTFIFSHLVPGKGPCRVGWHNLRSNISLTPLHVRAVAGKVLRCKTHMQSKDCRVGRSELWMSSMGDSP